MLHLLFPELWSGVGQPEDSGGEDEVSAPQSEQRCVAAQEEPRLSQQKLPSTLQRVPDRRGRADRSCQESVSLAGQVDTNILITYYSHTSILYTYVNTISVSYLHHIQKHV